MPLDSNFYNELREREWRYVDDFGPSAQSRYRMIKKLLRKHCSKDSFVHDIGCGGGNLLLELRNKGYSNLTGSDFSVKAVSLAKERFRGKLYCADVTKRESFPSLYYEVILCSEVLEHIKEDELAIENIGHLLKKNGIVIISVPFLMSHWSRHDSSMGHVRRYEFGELEQKLRRNGFKILNSFSWGNFLYPFYYFLIMAMSPEKIRSEKGARMKKVIGKIINFFLRIDDLFLARKLGRRLYVVARKK